MLKILAFAICPICFTFALSQLETYSDPEQYDSAPMAMIGLIVTVCWTYSVSGTLVFIDWIYWKNRKNK